MYDDKEGRMRHVAYDQVSIHVSIVFVAPAIGPEAKYAPHALPLRLPLASDVLLSDDLYRWIAETRL